MRAVAPVSAAGGKRLGPRECAIATLRPAAVNRWARALPMPNHHSFTQSSFCCLLHLVRSSLNKEGRGVSGAGAARRELVLLIGVEVWLCIGWVIALLNAPVVDFNKVRLSVGCQRGSEEDQDRQESLATHAGMLHTVSTVMSSSWPNCWAVRAISSAACVEMAAVRSKPNSSPCGSRASTTPSETKVNVSPIHK